MPDAINSSDPGVGGTGNGPLARPPEMLAIVSVLVILGIAYLLAVVIGNCIVRSNLIMATITIMVLTPGSAALMLQQYRGTFRGSPSAAAMASRALYSSCVATILACCAAVGTFILSKDDPLFAIPSLIQIALLAAPAFIAGYMNECWSCTLRESGRSTARMIIEQVDSIDFPR